jgi:predicted permease
MFRDLRHGARMLLQAKGWTLVVILSLALGIGANTAIFTAINGLVLQTLPVAHPDSLVRLRWVGENDMGTDFSDYGFSEKDGGRDVRPTFPYPMYLEFRRANQTLDDLFATAPQGPLNVVSDGRAELASSFIASGNYFQVLGISAIAGRLFTPDDDRPDAPPVAVISEGYWKRRFGSDREVIGRVVQMNNVPVTIIGVTPARFTGVQQVMTEARDVTLPLSLDPQMGGRPGPGPSPDSITPPRLQQATSWWLQIMGRLKPGVTAEQVRGNLGGVFQEAARQGWTTYFDALPDTERLKAGVQNRTKVPELRVASGARGVYDVSADTYRSITLLSVVVGLVLLIVCANVANLLLSRAATRQREISVRLSMGATRWRLVRQLLTESLLVSSLGGGFGTLVAYWGRQLLPRNLATTTTIDWRVLLFVSGLTLVTGIVFGIAPALRASGLNVATALKEGGRSVSGSRSKLGKSLLVVQVAMSLVLLIGAGLFLRTVQNLRRVDVGFNAQNLLLVAVNPLLNRYDQPRILSLYRQLLERFPTVPGVRAVSLSNPALLSGSTNSGGIYIQGRAKPNDRNNMNRLVVSPTFFDTLGIPFVLGRGFTMRDDQAAPKVVIINEAAARKYFPKQPVIGLRFGMSYETSGQMEIVGIVRDARYNSLRDAVPPTMYVPFLQTRVASVTFELRTLSDPVTMIPAIREAVRQVDPNLPILNVATQTEQIERRFAQEKVFAQAYAWFSGLALLLASIGLFGLMSYSVARRTHEIGVRMALGARRPDVIGMVMSESLLLVGIGIVIGVGTAMAAGRFVTSLLFGIAPSDSISMAGAVAVMAAVSALAGYLPARRAARVDPMIALRYE